MHWGDITHAKYLHYKQQVDLLNGDGNASTYESVLHDDDDKFEENALIFAIQRSPRVCYNNLWGPLLEGFCFLLAKVPKSML